MPYPDLFIWWAIIISGGSIFLTLVSIYLYADSRIRQKKNTRTTANIVSLLKGFIFVWVLLGLLVFYIFSIQMDSIEIFAAGNIAVEAILVAYLMKNRTRKSEQIPSPRSK